MPHVPDTVPGKRVDGAGARTEGRGQPSNIRGGTRIQESCTYGSVRGAPSTGRPYRNHETGSGFGASSEFRADRLSARRYPSGQSSASANPIERFRRIEEPTRRRMKAPALSAGHRGTESSNPFPSSGESTNHRFLPHMTPSAACIAPGVRGACGSRSLAHVTQFTKGAAASLARISARSERRYAGDQLGWCNSGFSREARSVHPAARANSSKNPRS